MPIATIDIVPEYETVKEDILNDLLWYDIETKKMHRWKGTRVAFKYENGKTIAFPQIEKHNVQKRGDNLNKVLNWISQHDDLDIELISQDSREITIAFPKANENLVEDLMYSERFRYEIKDA